MAAKRSEEIEEREVSPENDPHRLVKIKLRRDKNSKSKGLYANVNNHNFFIPRGEVVEVPYYIAAMLEISADQDENTAAMIDSLGAGANF